jgi:hypothetical protein
MRRPVSSITTTPPGLAFGSGSACPRIFADLVFLSTV